MIVNKVAYMYQRMINQTIKYGKIGYLLEFSMAYHHAMDGSSCILNVYHHAIDGPCEKEKLTIKLLLKAYHREVELSYQCNRIISMVAYAY